MTKYQRKLIENSITSLVTLALLHHKCEVLESNSPIFIQEGSIGTLTKTIRNEAPLFFKNFQATTADKHELVGIKHYPFNLIPELKIKPPEKLTTAILRALDNIPGLTELLHFTVATVSFVREVDNAITDRNDIYMQKIDEHYDITTHLRKNLLRDPNNESEMTALEYSKFITPVINEDLNTVADAYDQLFKLYASHLPKSQADEPNLLINT